MTEKKKTATATEPTAEERALEALEDVRKSLFEGHGKAANAARVAVAGIGETEQILAVQDDDGKPIIGPNAMALVLEGARSISKHGLDALNKLGKDMTAVSGFQQGLIRELRAQRDDLIDQRDVMASLLYEVLKRAGKRPTKKLLTSIQAAVNAFIGDSKS